MSSRSTADDHAEITQCLQRYGQAFDDRAWDVFESVFTPDAHIRYDIEGRVTELRADELAASARELFERFWWTQHMFSVPVIELAGDSARATCRLIATHVQVSLEGQRSTWVVYGIYRDVLTGTLAGWRIRERHLHGVYSEGQLLSRKRVQCFASAPASAGCERTV
jgi:3-phenylpropionate/cinnamic acid dioxygenase small subunit